MLISYVDNVDNFLLFVENSFENRLKLHISLSIERIKFKMPGSQGHSTTSVQAHVVSDLLTLTSKSIMDHYRISHLNQII